MHQPSSKISELLAGWSWRKSASPDEQKWIRCKHDRPATQIHVDLLDAGQIKDPLLGLNENDVQWIGEQDWDYKATFNCSEMAKDRQHQVLSVESLGMLEIHRFSIHCLTRMHCFQILSQLYLSMIPKFSRATTCFTSIE